MALPLERDEVLELPREHGLSLASPSAASVSRTRRATISAAGSRVPLRAAPSPASIGRMSARPCSEAARRRSATSAGLRAPAERSGIGLQQRVDEAVANPAGRASRDEVGDDGALGRRVGQRLGVDVRGTALGAAEEARAERHALGAERERRGDSAAVHDAAGGHDRDAGRRRRRRSAARATSCPPPRARRRRRRSRGGRPPRCPARSRHRLRPRPPGGPRPPS